MRMSQVRSKLFSSTSKRAMAAKKAKSQAPKMS